MLIIQLANIYKCHMTAENFFTISKWHNNSVHQLLLLYIRFDNSNCILEFKRERKKRTCNVVFADKALRVAGVEEELHSMK
jgi:hypothetical protein